MNETLIVQLITGAIGSVGFGILFHMKKKYLPLVAGGGFISWLMFVLGKSFWGNIFLPTLFASFLTDSCKNFRIQYHEDIAGVDFKWA